MKKINLLAALCLSLAAWLGAPRALSAESGIVFDPSKGNMTGQLNMGNYAIWSSSDITAARYQINGSTVLAILPGTDSLGVGVGAGNLNTGSQNSFLGAYAGYSNTGDYNSFLGYSAGFFNNSGLENSFLGYSAGYSNTSGGDNSFLGANAGYSNTTGEYNSFLGAYAGYSNTTGGSNSSLGYAAGYSNTTGGSNSSLGYAAGYSNTTGSSNSFLGNSAGNNNTTGSSSTIVGSEAGYNVTTGNDNIFLGWRAGYAGTTGAGNIVIGYNKDTSAPAANNELNIGGVLYGNLSAKTIGISTRAPQAALDIVSTGTLVSQYAQVWRDSTGLVVASMTANGKLSTLQTLPGDNLGNHVATTQLSMGNYAVWSSSDITAARYQINGSTVLAVTGTESLNIGLNAGRVNTGQYSVFVGPWSGYNNTASNNTFIGYTAGYTNTTGSNNVALGFQALYQSVSSNNTAVGVNAMKLGANGGANTAVGSSALYQTTGSGNAAMGYMALYSLVAGDYNTASGDFALGGGTGGSYNTASGYQALATGGASSNNAAFGSNAGNQDTSGAYNAIVGADAAFYNQTGGNNAVLGYRAGYGVTGNSFANSTLIGYKAGYGLINGSGNNVFLGYQAGDSITTGAGNIVIGYDQDASAATASNELNIGGVLYGDLAAKTIGISTRVPQAALDIVSTGTLVSQYAQIWRDSTGLVVASMTANGKLSTLQTLPGDNLGNHNATQALNMANKAVDNVSSATITGTGVTGSDPLFKVAGSTLVVLNNGNVGIGTTGSGYKLEVNDNSINWASRIYQANADGYGLVVNVNNEDTDKHILGAYSGGTYKMVVRNDGNVGIGTATPSGLLTVRSNASPTGYALAISSQDAITGNLFNVTGSGNVGIGTTGPGAKLQITGGDAAISTQGNGLILKATDGAACFRVTVNDSGTLATASVTCP